MNKKLILVYILFIIYINPVLGYTWNSDSKIIPGISGMSHDVTGVLTVYFDGQWKAIQGQGFGQFNGYIWNGSYWNTDSNLTAGLIDTGYNAAPEVFDMDGDWILISGSTNVNAYYGYIWSGTSWVSYPYIVNGLSTGGDNRPAIFKIDNIWRLIDGQYTGTFYGFNWDSINEIWVSNSTIVSGLTDVGYFSKPEIFYDNSNIILIAGAQSGQFTGFHWNSTSTTWVSNSSVVGGLGDIGAYSFAAIFPMRYFDMVALGNIGVYGYNLSSPGNLPIILNWGNNFTNDNSVNFSINSNKSINFNVTANQTITNWNWYKNGTNQYNNFNNLTIFFNNISLYTIAITATNSNGTSNTIIWNINMTGLCSGTCDIYATKNGSDTNSCLSWAQACLNISRAEALVSNYGTTHIGYGDYWTQPAMNGSMVKSIEYFCDSVGYQENASQPWCDMPRVNSS